MPSSSVRIAKGAMVCEGAELSGDITIGPETVVFPGARLRSSAGAGPVVIGRGCVIEEGASVVNMGPGEMRIGDGNLFEVGCTVYANQVGDYNAFQPKCAVGQEVTVPSGCTFAPTVSLSSATVLESNTSVFRSGGEVDEYNIRRRSRNIETNRAKLNAYRAALSNQGKKYFLGKYNKILPSTEGAES